MEEILFLEHFPWVGFGMEWNADQCISAILSSHSFIQKEFSANSSQKNVNEVLMKYSNLFRWWIGAFLLNVSQNHYN